MLKNIPPILSPQLFKTRISHGEKFMIGAGGFPADSTERDRIVFRAEGKTAVYANNLLKKGAAT